MSVCVDVWGHVMHAIVVCAEVHVCMQVCECVCMCIECPSLPLSFIVLFWGLFVGFGFCAWLGWRVFCCCRAECLFSVLVLFCSLSHREWSGGSVCVWCVVLCVSCC